MILPPTAAITRGHAHALHSFGVLPVRMTGSRIDLSIYKLKDELVDAFENWLRAARRTSSLPGILDGDRTVSIHDVNLGAPETSAVFVIAQTKEALPSWAGFFRPALPNIARLLHPNAANSAALLVAIDRRMYAVVFGYGRHLLDEDAIVRGFGLRSALSILDPDRMRHLGFKEVEARTLFGELQTSQGTQFHNFSLNPDAQMLRGVQGAVSAAQSRWATHAFGTDALQVNPNIDIHGLPQLLRWVTNVDRGKAYATNFAWVDYIRQVTDRVQIRQLKAALLQHLQSGGLGVALGTPEPIDLHAGFTYRVGRTKAAGTWHDELTPEVLQDVSLDSYDELKAQKIFVVNPNGDTVHKWSVWRCLSGEFRCQGTRHVIQDGDFFEIDPAYENRLDARLMRSGASSSRCPPWNTNQCATEAEYNRELLLPNIASGSACLDGKCLSTYRGHSQIELCDVFEYVSPKTTMYFVKKYNGGSSAISHLAAQASVSAEALRDDSTFRDDATGKWPVVKQALGTFDPRGVEVRLCIAVPGNKTKKKKLADLPFFAKLTLAQRADRIRALGYGLEIELFYFS